MGKPELIYTNHISNDVVLHTFIMFEDMGYLKEIVKICLPFVCLKNPQKVVKSYMGYICTHTED